MESSQKSPMLSDKVYDFIKRMVLSVLPGMATLYFTLGSIWGLPHVEQIVGTFAAIATFLGILLRMSAQSYNDSDLAFDGVVNITAQTDGSKVYSLDLHDGNSATLDQKASVVFKVNPSVRVE